MSEDTLTFEILLAYDMESITCLSKILKNNDIYIVSVETCSIVNQFGKIVKPVYNLICKGTLDNYLTFKTKYPIGIIV